MCLFHRVFFSALLVLFAGAAGLAPAAPAVAQDLEAPVFAVVDVQKVLRESTAVMTLTREIDEERARYQAELREKEEVLRNADQELARQRTVLSADAYGKRRQEMEQEIATLQREVQIRKRELDQRFAAGMSEVQNTLARIAADLANERNLDMIISKAAVLINKPKFDLTDEAIERLNTRLPKVTGEAQTN